MSSLSGHFLVPWWSFCNNLAAPIMSEWSDGSTAVVTGIVYEPPRGLASEAIRDGAEFTLYRRRRDGKPAPVLVVPLTAEQPSPQSLHRLNHVSTRSQPILSPHGRPSHRRSRVTRGGQSWFSPTRAVRLSRDREKTLDLARLRRLAINLARAPRHVYQCGLIHQRSCTVGARNRFSSCGVRPGGACHRRASRASRIT